MRRALVCSYGAPQPDRDSGSRRLLDHLEFLLEAGWQVDFVSNTGLRDSAYVEALRGRGVAVFERDHIDSLLTHSGYDVALFSFWQNAEQHISRVRRLSPRTRVVVDSVDMQLLRDARRLLAAHDGLLASDYAAEAIGELNVYAAADHVLTVSTKEAELIGEFLADANAATAIPDSEDLARSSRTFNKRRGLLFVGSFAHPPNLQAVEFLCTDILPQLDPQILEEHPLSIVGAGLNEMVRKYAQRIPNVQLVGWVPSVIPYLERARVSVIPLRYGAGTKRKLLQSLMLGTPAVSTTIGVEGLELVHGQHVLVADDPTSFAGSIERLLRDDKLWRAISAAGHDLIAPLHGRAAVKEHFVSTLEKVLMQPAKAPLLGDPAPWIFGDRMRYQENQKIVPFIRDTVEQLVPSDQKLWVISDGCDELLRVHDDAAHLPSDAFGRWTGHFSSGDAAVARIVDAIAGKPTYVLLPATNFWMLDLWPELAEFLTTRSDTDQTVSTERGVVYAFNSPPRVPARVAEPPPLTFAPDGAPAKLIAFYLPQFHPIPENDEWWGEGFTEWTNVTRAEPLFPGHAQPHLPADLGFYDLRLPEVRRKQVELARAAGIHAFCYYHYWFGGKRLLERPFDDVLASGEPDFPFCLCWANEPWSRGWDGREHDVLQPQVYSKEDDLAHIRWLLPALSDPRALRVDGKPVFLVYQAHELPDAKRTTDLWRREVKAAGLGGLHLIAVETGWDANQDVTDAGFDAKVLFMPQFSILGTAPRMTVESESLRVYDYDQAWPLLANPEPVGYRRYPSVFPSWDNTPRRGENGWVVHNSSPQSYEAWLRQTIAGVAHEDPDHRLVFINAWNEWAEGAYLEPDRHHGHAYLEATRRALAANVAAPPPTNGLATEAVAQVAQRGSDDVRTEAEQHSAVEEAKARRLRRVRRTRR